MKTPLPESLFNKLAGLGPATLLKKHLPGELKLYLGWV